MTALPDPIGDVSFRHFGGEQDFVGMVNVLNVTAEHDRVDRWDTVEGMANSYAHLTNSDLDTDLLIAEVRAGIVGYGRCLWWIEDATGDRILAFVFWVLPEFRVGVEHAMVRWFENRLRDIAAGRPTERRQHLRTWADHNETSKIDALTEAGFEVTEIDFQMARSLHDPIPDHPLPAGLELRPVTEDHRRRLWDAGVEAFRDHVGYSIPTEADFREFLGNPDLDPALWRVAFEGDEVVGQVRNYMIPAEIRKTGRKRGWTEDISTKREWRGRGVAKALITESMRMFKDMGMDEVTLGVHTTNPTGALALYEGLGYIEESRSYEYSKPL